MLQKCYILPQCLAESVAGMRIACKHSILKLKRSNGLGDADFGRGTIMLHFILKGQNVRSYSGISGSG
jgi:hypothetical protein